MKLLTPRIIGLVVVTGNADLSGVAATEAGSVFPVDHFIKAVSTPQARIGMFKGVARHFVDTPLTSNDWKNRIAASSTHGPASCVPAVAVMETL